jgi:DNA-binding MarR family transcriptional regulator
MLRHTRQAARAITALYERASEPLGIRATQLTLLVGVVEADGAPFGALAEALGMDRTTLARELALLEKEGLVEIYAGADRRRRCARLTPRGRSVVKNGLPIWAHVHDHVQRAVSEPRFAELRAALQEIASLENLEIPEYVP